jgi:hypothetical protein
VFVCSFRLLFPLFWHVSCTTLTCVWCVRFLWFPLLCGVFAVVAFVVSLVFPLVSLVARLVSLVSVPLCSRWLLVSRVFSGVGGSCVGLSCRWFSAV